MAVTSIASDRGPGRDPFQPLVDELTRKLDSSAGASVLQYFDSNGEFLRLIEPDDYLRAGFNPEMETVRNVRSKILDRKVAYIQKLKKDGLQFDGEKPKKLLDCKKQFVVFENLPRYMQIMKEVGCDNESYISISGCERTISMAISEQAAEHSICSLMFLNALKMHDIVRQLLECDESVSEVRESLEVMQTLYIAYGYALGHLQTMSKIDETRYTKLERALEDIPLWNTRYGAAATYLRRDDSEFGGMDMILSSFTSLMAPHKDNEDSIAIQQQRLHDELRFRNITTELSEKIAWHNPFEELKTASARARLIDVYVRGGGLVDGFASRVLHSLHVDKNDILILSCTSLIEIILKDRRDEGAPIAPDKAHKLLADYLALLHQNKGVKPFHLHAGYSKPLSELPLEFRELNDIVDFLRHTQIRTRLLPFEPDTDYFKQKDLEGCTPLFIDAEDRTIVYDIGFNARSRMIFKGVSKDIFRLNTTTLISEHEPSHCFSAAIATATKHMEYVGISNSNLLEVVGKDRFFVRHFTAVAGMFTSDIKLADNSDSEVPTYGADFNLYAIKTRGDDDDDGPEIITSDAPDGVVLPY